MSFVIIFNELHDALMKAIDKALDGRPCYEPSREFIYGQLVAYYNEHGVIPDFTLGVQVKP